MCDPISAIALAGSAVAAGINYQGQQATQAAQQDANDQWVAYQRQAAATAAAKDQANRQKAQAAETATLNAVSPQTQQANQEAAASSLTDQMLAGSPAADNSNVTVLGGGDPANTKVTQDMAQRITSASRAAQGRIKALASVQSYGGGYEGMGRAAGTAINTGNEAIKLASDMRQGDTSTLDTAHAVQPVHYEQGSNIAGTLADKLAGIGGSAFASSGAGKSLGNWMKGIG